MTKKKTRISDLIVKILIILSAIISILLLITIILFVAIKAVSYTHLTLPTKA